jgi:hypothetical protein
MIINTGSSTCYFNKGLYQITEKSYWYEHEKKSFKRIKTRPVNGAFCCRDNSPVCG